MNEGVEDSNFTKMAWMVLQSEGCVPGGPIDLPEEAAGRCNRSLGYSNSDGLVVSMAPETELQRRRPQLLQFLSAKGAAATGWSLWVYLRGLKWLGVNARGIRVVTTGRRLMWVLPVVLL